ncbi:transketolase [Nanoarchaeota archaeon]
MNNRIGFESESIDSRIAEELKETADLCRGDILLMTTAAGNGHPGGSMSSVDFLTLLFATANVNPDDKMDLDRDRIFLSAGHLHPAELAVRARYGFIGEDPDAEIEDIAMRLRQEGSRYPGHSERGISEFSTGVLGQGLSAAAGMAMGAKLTGRDYNVFVLMGDGEQQKGQQMEARDFANKYGLNVVGIVDHNRLQISGDVGDVMPQDIRAKYEADGWKVFECNGHDFQNMYSVLRSAVKHEGPAMILSQTTMGKGVSFMEDKEKYHGSVVPLVHDSGHDLRHALEELGQSYRIEGAEDIVRQRKDLEASVEAELPKVPKHDGYDPNKKSWQACRGAYGDELYNLAKERNSNGHMSVVGIDCDLGGSTKITKLDTITKRSLLQMGIQEGNAATVAGALSLNHELSVFFSTFSMFAVEEVFSQQRMNDLNETNLKTFYTHRGTVGPDGNSHHSIRDIGMAMSLFDANVILPADANQVRQVVNHAHSTQGNFFVGMTRDKTPIILDEDGTPYFENHAFEYGKAQWIRRFSPDSSVRERAVIFAMGNMLYRALDARALLAEKGYDVGIVNVHSPKVHDQDTIKEATSQCHTVITYEDHHIDTGYGARLGAFLQENGFMAMFSRLGWMRNPGSGKTEDLFRSAGLDAHHLADFTKQKIARANLRYSSGYVPNPRVIMPLLDPSHSQR